LGKCGVLALLKESEGNHYGDHDGYERDTLLPSIGFDKDADYDGKGDDADQFVHASAFGRGLFNFIESSTFYL
jgi:hypothetical protein